MMAWMPLLGFMLWVSVFVEVQCQLRLAAAMVVNRAWLGIRAVDLRRQPDQHQRTGLYVLPADNGTDILQPPALLIVPDAEPARPKAPLQPSQPMQSGELSSC